MKPTGSKSGDAEQKGYKKVPVAGETFKTDYIKTVDGKASKDVAKIKRSEIKQ